MPFVIVDCGTLGENLIESELFGHEKGAFTGANNMKKGLFEVADGGTLFIDEIGELPLSLQTKLLRALESGTIRRLGGTGYIKVNVRVIAATNKNLKEMSDRGEFRQDLYYRLSAFPVNIPALRERPDDIPALAEHFLLHMEEGDRFVPLSPEVIETLLTYDYPGNVRELRNILFIAATHSRNGDIDNDTVAEVMQLHAQSRLQPCVHRAVEAVAAPVAPGVEKTASLQDVEAEHISRLLAEHNNNRRKVAAVLGISERTLYRKLKRFNLS
jgi:transcriptional regulator with GAF, ATPase, and Fis domain